MNNDDVYQGTQAIRRAVAVLKAFGPEPELLTAPAISQRTGLNRSTVYRLLSALEHEGLVAAEGGGRYRLGPDLAILGTLALRQINLRDVALPAMRALADRSGETVDLEILHGASVLLVEELAGDHLLSATSNLGMLYPAHCTSTGKLLLAELPPATLDTLLAQPLAACGPQAITSAAELRAELQVARERGYATSYEELEAHLHAVAAPVRDLSGRVVAAISISGPAARLPRQREAEVSTMLIAACAEVSRALGYRPGRPPVL